MPDTVKQSRLPDDWSNWTDREVISEIIRLTDLLHSDDITYIQSQSINFRIYRLTKLILKEHYGDMIVGKARRFIGDDEATDIPSEILRHIFEYGSEDWGGWRQMLKNEEMDDIGGYLHRTVHHYLLNRIQTTKKEDNTVLASDLASDSDDGTSDRDYTSISQGSQHDSFQPEYPEVDPYAVKTAESVGARIPIDSRYDFALSHKLETAITDCNSGFKDGDAALEVLMLRADGEPWEEIMKLPGVEAPSCDALQQRVHRMILKLKQMYPELLKRDLPVATRYLE